MGLFGKIFGSGKVDFEQEIRSAYLVKGFIKTNVDWGKSFAFAKAKNSQICNGDEDISFYMFIDTEEVWVRFLKNPRNEKTVIIVSKAEIHRQMIEEMETGEFDFDKYPSYKLEF